MKLKTNFQRRGLLSHLLTLSLTGLLLSAGAATNDLSLQLQKGLFEEEANHDYSAAARAYEAIVSDFDKDRKLAATAVFRLGEVYRKQGKTNEAALQYQRIIKEFSDQTALVASSRQHLPAPADPGAVAVNAATTQRTLRQTAPMFANDGTISMDNQNAVFTGNWMIAAAAPDRFGPDYHFAATVKKDNQQFAVATFRPHFPETGEYHVEVWYPRGENRSTNSQWTITAAEEQPVPPISVNQRLNGGKWSRIATNIHFAKGISGWVQLSNATGETGTVVVADAVRFVPVNALAVTKDTPEIAGSTADESQEIQKIQALIRNSPDLVNAVNIQIGEGEKPDMGAPLHRAAMKGQIEVAKFLVENGADIELKSKDGYSPLHLAAINGHKAIVELLLDRGAQLEGGAGGAGTALHMAASRKYGSIVSLLLQRGADIKAVDSRGNTPLHVSARAGQTNIMQALIGKGANVNATNKESETPLFSAIRVAQSVDAARLLIEKGANVNALAKDTFNNQMVPPLYIALRYKAAPLVGLLLEHGADATGRFNYEYYSGNVPLLSPLEFAVKNGDVKLVDVLLKHGMDPNETDPSGFPVIYQAVWWKPDALEILLKSGAKPSKMSYPDGQVRTPLSAALDLQQPSADVVKLLLDYKDDPNFKDKSGKTLLHNSVDKKLTKIAELLIAAGADVNAKDSAGETPLFAAIRTANKDLVATLVRSGASLNIISLNGVTPLGAAKRMVAPGPSYSLQQDKVAAQEILALLLKQGASDDLERKLGIFATRPGWTEPQQIRFRGVQATNTSAFNNEFTLLEMVVELPAIDRYKYPKGWSFPDYSKVKVSRMTATGKTEFNLDLQQALDSGDCGKDITLQWGDVVEIAERDHRIDESWSGLDEKTAGALDQCLKRTVQLVVKNVTNSIALYATEKGAREASYKRLMPSRPILPGQRVQPTMQTNEVQPDIHLASFWLNTVVRSSGMLHASSDLSRVSVTRRTGSGTEHATIDLTAKPLFDLWLRDGDFIVVPESDRPFATTDSATVSIPAVPLPPVSPAYRSLPTRTLQLPPPNGTVPLPAPDQTNVIPAPALDPGLRQIPTKTLRLPTPKTP